jgi:UDP-N-acetylglucosamine 2-epimerase (non-hydrolysing)
MHVVGARPNFPKTAPIMAEMARRGGRFQQLLIHTGQHYDYNMSRVFFEELELPEPEEYLAVGSGSHAQQTADTMKRLEPVLLKHRPDWVVVVGDVNSTVASALVCAKMGIRVAHVEAGLRSRDRTMPEEINRVITDQLSDLLLVPSPDGLENLRREGIDEGKVHYVGNVMIDTLVCMLPRAERRAIMAELCLQPRHFVLVTLHRPSNVDDAERLDEILRALEHVARTVPVLFPVHPRTRHQIDALRTRRGNEALRLVDPLGYVDFLALMRAAGLVVTDSGGVQEETTFLGIPCLTVRPNTERPITISQGTNRLVASRYGDLVDAVNTSLGASRNGHRVPELWDGKAAARIVDILAR